MKKTITKSDGTQEVVEGTPSEIAEYERKLRDVEAKKESPSPKNPGLLTDELRRFTESFPEIKPPSDPVYPTFPVLVDHSPNCLIKVAERGWWSVVPPHCTCGLIAYPSSFRYKTGTSTGYDIEEGFTWNATVVKDCTSSTLQPASKIKVQ